MNINDYCQADEIETITAGLATKFHPLAELIELRESSVEGLKCHALYISTLSRTGRISTGPRTDARDCVMIIAGVHAAEWGSCEIALNLASDLLEAHSPPTGPAGLSYGGQRGQPGQVFPLQTVQNLLAQRDIVIFPLVNPDGRNCSRKMPGRELWRKNRNPAYANGDPERIGVDINRNFDFLFDKAAFAQGAGLSASTDESSAFYQGPKFFSEPETRNVRELLDLFPSTRWFIDLHSTGRTIRYVWHDDEAQHTVPGMHFQKSAFDGQRGLPGPDYKEFLAKTDSDAMDTLAQHFVAAVKNVHGTVYSAGPAFQFNPFSGTSHDYAYSRHLVDSDKYKKVLAFCVEWGLGDCQPEWQNMQPIIEEVTAGLIEFCIATQ